jgi:hypothetical protein
VAALTALLGLALLPAFWAPPPASSASLAYVAGNEVWVSTLDGKQKTRLSGGEGDWRAVTAADGGRILGVRLESGKIFQLSRIQLWNENGRVISRGPLPSESTGWSSYVAPVGLDLSSDGVFLAYGYSGYTGVVPNAFFFSGHYVVNSDTKTLIQPIGQGGYEWPTLFGRRVVAASGSQAVIQAPGSGPFGTTFTPIVETSGTGLDLARTDIAAGGRVLALDLQADSGNDRIAIVSISGVEPPVTVGASVDCFIPSVGDASNASISQDGSRIAWEDDRGVMIAGVPKSLGDPCVFSSAPVRISAAGSSPSIGGAAFSNLKPPSVPVATLPPAIRVDDLAGAGGVGVRVRVGAGGKVSISGTVPRSRLGLGGRGRVVVVTGSVVARRAGTVTVRLRLVSRYRKYRTRLRGATVRLLISQGTRRVSRNVRLR